MQSMSEKILVMYRKYLVLVWFFINTGTFQEMSKKSSINYYALPILKYFQEVSWVVIEACCIVD